MRPFDHLRFETGRVELGRNEPVEDQPGLCLVFVDQVHELDS